MYYSLRLIEMQKILYLLWTLHRHDSTLPGRSSSTYMAMKLALISKFGGKYNAQLLWLLEDWLWGFILGCRTKFQIQIFVVHQLLAYLIIWGSPQKWNSECYKGNETMVIISTISELTWYSKHSNVQVERMLKQNDQNQHLTRPLSS